MPVYIGVDDSPLAEDGVPYPLARSKGPFAFPVGPVFSAVLDVVPSRPDEAVRRRIVIGQHFRAHIQNKPRRIADCTVEVLPVCFGQIQAPFGPRQGYEGQTPFFFHGLHRPHLPRRENAFVQAAQEHVGKFQPLGGVNRHELDLVVIRRGVGVGKQGHVG